MVISQPSGFGDVECWEGHVKSLQERINVANARPYLHLEGWVWLVRTLVDGKNTISGGAFTCIYGFLAKRLRNPQTGKSSKGWMERSSFQIGRSVQSHIRHRSQMRPKRWLKKKPGIVQLRCLIWNPSLFWVRPLCSWLVNKNWAELGLSLAMQNREVMNSWWYDIIRISSCS